MKALIYNAGLGSRMGDLCKDIPKCLLTLYNGETVLDRQIRILAECGIREFVIVTGAHGELLRRYAMKYPGLCFHFVSNPRYQTTNYIVSFVLAEKYLTGDFLLLHGDLVFNKAIVDRMLADQRENLCLYNEMLPLPPKDFKGRFSDGSLREVSVNLFETDCRAFQPLYKLGKEAVALWLQRAKAYVAAGNETVYAENALNELLQENALVIEGMSYRDDFVEEIDNAEDYGRVKERIREFDARERIFVVCSERTGRLLGLNGRKAVYFHDFSPNPKWEEIETGISAFSDSGCKVIVSVGGGSAIDTAKAILHFSGPETVKNCCHIAVPTTAGTGSESSGIAIYYRDGKKCALQEEALLPRVAILEKSLLRGLSDYQKKATYLDALCQGIESYWAKGATKESRFYAAQCIRLLWKNRDAYLGNETEGKIPEEEVLQEISLGANYSGKAIHISKTTAPHAMSYKLTGLYQIAHGHAVMLSLLPIGKMLERKALKESAETAGLSDVLASLAGIFGKAESLEGYAELMDMLKQWFLKLGLESPEGTEEELSILTEAVDPERLSNHPTKLTKEEIGQVYREILIKKME